MKIMSITEWAKKHRETPPYLKNVVDQITDDKVEKVVLLKGKDRAAFISGVQCGGKWFLINENGTQQEIDKGRISSPNLTEFKQKYLANPWKPTKGEL